MSEITIKQGDNNLLNNVWRYSLDYQSLKAYFTICPENDLLMGMKIYQINKQMKRGQSYMLVSYTNLNLKAKLEDNQLILL